MNPVFLLPLFQPAEEILQREGHGTHPSATLPAEARGQWIGSVTDNQIPDQGNIGQFLEGWSINGQAGGVGDVAITWSPGAGDYISHTAVEYGGVLPFSVGVSATYSIKLFNGPTIFWVMTMKNIMGVLLSSLLLLYILFIAFYVWLKPKQYLGYLHERRARLKSRFQFMPDWLIGFIFFYEQPQLSIWWARIVLLVAALLCILGLIAAVHGPF